MSHFSSIKFASGIMFLFLIFLIPKPVLATSGACSWHGGVNCGAGMQYDGKVFCNDGWTESSTYYYYTEACGSLVNNYSWCFTPPIVGCTNSYDFDSKRNQCDRTYSMYVGAGALEMGKDAFDKCQQELNVCQQQIDSYNQGWTDYYQCLDDEAAERSLQREQELEILKKYFDAEEERQNNELCQVRFGDYSYASGTECRCQSGYTWNVNQTSCVLDCSTGYIQVFDSCLLPTQYCSSVFGSHAYGISGSDTVEGTCFCESGYEWNEKKTACIKPEEPVKETILDEPSQLQEVELILPPDESERMKRLRGIVEQLQEETGEVIKDARVTQVEKDINVDRSDESVLDKESEVIGHPILQESEINDGGSTENQKDKTNLLARLFQGIKNALEKFYSILKH